MLGDINAKHFSNSSWECGRVNLIFILELVGDVN